MICNGLPDQNRVRAFTLVELLVVIALLAVIAGLLLAAVQRARETANRAQCLGNVKQIGLALQSYHDTFGSFPHAYDCRALFTNPSQVWDGTQWIATKSWATLILPFLEQEKPATERGQPPVQDATPFLKSWVKVASQGIPVPHSQRSQYRRKR